MRPCTSISWISMLTSFYWFRVPNLLKKNKYSISKPPLPYRNSIIVSLRHDRPLCEFEGRKHKSLTLDLSTNYDKEAEMADKEEGFNDDSKQDILSCQRLTKRSLYRVKKKFMKKCCIDISSYTPSKPHQLWPISSYLTSFKGRNISNNGAIDFVGARS